MKNVYFSDVLNKLIEWTLDGLDLEQAVTQPESAFKVRHLKMGIKMAGSLCSLSAEISNKLLVNSKTQFYYPCS